VDRDVLLLWCPQCRTSLTHRSGCPSLGSPASAAPSFQSTPSQKTYLIIITERIPASKIISTFRRRLKIAQAYETMEIQIILALILYIANSYAQPFRY
jgi:hypothetical protein